MKKLAHLLDDYLNNGGINLEKKTLDGYLESYKMYFQNEVDKSTEELKLLDALDGGEFETEFNKRFEILSAKSSLMAFDSFSKELEKIQSELEVVNIVLIGSDCPLSEESLANLSETLSSATVQEKYRHMFESVGLSVLSFIDAACQVPRS